MDSSASSMVDPTLTSQIHVLLVDHDTNAHAPIIHMLEYFFLQVTTVKLASTALAILAKGEAKYDLLLENIHSPDACGYKLLQEAVKMDLPVILLFEEDDILLTKMGLEDGALLCIKKPITVEIARYLWQLVVWEKTRIRKQNEVYNNIGSVGELNFEANSEESHNNVVKIKRRQKRSQKRVTLRGKVWTEWTQELHDKFMVAVRQLGEGRCYPKDILELMNVPGLTRMQVASHLQKCRSGSWVAPSKRKGAKSWSSAKRVCRGSPRKFGFMPTPTSLTNFNIQHITPNQYMVFDMEDYKASPISFPSTIDWGVDAHSVAANASPNQTHYFDEFPNVDSVIQSFCAFEEVPITYNMPVMNSANMEKLEKASENRDDDDDDDDDDGDYDDGKIQVVVKKEEH